MDRISRLEVLRQLERGEITLEECNRLLGLEAGLSTPVMSTPIPTAPPVMPAPVPPVAPAAEAFVVTPEVEPAPPAEDLQRYRGWRWVWLVPFGLGLLLMLLAVNWMLMGFQAAGLSWGFWFSFFPFALGVLIMVLGWDLRNAVWLHVRVHQKPGSRPQKISISLPVPFGTTAWFLRTFGGRIHNLKNKPVGEFMDILNALNPNEPMVVQVDDKDGERVEVYLVSYK